MQDFNAMAPPPYLFAFNATPLPHLARHQIILANMWQSMDGFDFPQHFLSADDLGSLAATFGFLVQSNACDTFTRLFTTLFTTMLSQKMAYCNNREAKRQFFAFVRLHTYNSLLATKLRQNISKPDMARALVSLDVHLMMKIIENMIQARRAYLDKRAGRTATGPTTRPQSEFEKAATALSEQMANSLVMEDIDQQGGPDKNAEAKKAVEEYLALPETQGVTWPKLLLERLCSNVDVWMGEKFVNKQEKQGADEWTKVFGKTPKDTSEQGGPGPSTW
ncbi:hypothetical protein NKR19_g1416 [Coniochaeta hoffmannii]|uniref:Uncharacterized protein n=1 Tax=Coniochaeta hoffmannii TaxID=91930 RepID=A0AA38W3C3_9PEZI|nr:hypothetical protein NKR19_g1416 [Coniochaeta hoffmannii]